MKLLLATAMALAAFTVSVQAAALPSPKKLCQIISATADEGNNRIPKWQKSGNDYFCRSDGMSALDEGVVFMNTYQAAGSSKSRANIIFFRIQMFDTKLRTSEASQLILPRITNVFAASQAGPVPDALVQAITNLTSTSVPTTLGVAQTLLTLSNNESPYNGAIYAVKIEGP